MTIETTKNKHARLARKAAKQAAQSEDNAASDATETVVADEVIKSGAARDAAIAGVAASDDDEDTTVSSEVANSQLYKNPAPMPREEATGDHELYDSTMEAVYSAQTHGLKNFHIVRITGGKYTFEKKPDKPKPEPRAKAGSAGPKELEDTLNAPIKRHRERVAAASNAASTSEAAPHRGRAKQAPGSEPSGPAAKVFAILLAQPDGLSRRALADAMGWKAPAHQKLFHDGGKGYCDKWPAYQLEVIGTGKNEVYKITKLS